MSFLTPDITAPVTLKLSADEAKQEALGRTLGLTGALVGLVGAGMALQANPAVRAAVKSGTGVSMTIPAAQAKQEALGKSLALIGMGVGIVGSVIATASNPKIKAKLPAFVQNNQRNLFLGLAGVLAIATVWMISSQNKALMTTRFSTGFPP